MNVLTFTPGASAQYNRLIGREKQLLKEKRTAEALQLAAARDELVPYLEATEAETVRTLERLRPSEAVLRQAEKQGSLIAKIAGTLSWAGAIALSAALGGGDGACIGVFLGWVPALMLGSTIAEHVEAKKAIARRVESAAKLAGQLTELPTTEVNCLTSEQIALGFKQQSQTYQQQGLSQVSNQLHAQAEWLLMNRPGRDAHQLFDEARHMHPLDDRKSLLFEIVQRSADL